MAWLQMLALVLTSREFSPRCASMPSLVREGGSARPLHRHEAGALCSVWPGTEEKPHP